MPGLIGIAKNSPEIGSREVHEAREKISYYEWYKKDAIFEDKSLVATRAHLNITGDTTSPANIDDVYCWVEGEVFNTKNISDQNGIDAPSNALLFINAYNKQMLNRVCAQIDGHFSAVIYDQPRQLLYVISDRYGLKPIYIWNDHHHFAWSSEIKGFLAFSSFRPIIRSDSLKCFLELGHMMGDITWFENVEMLSASTIFRYDLNSKKTTRERYWYWSQIKGSLLDFEDAIDQLGRLLINAVKKRFSADEKIGLSLSGGLDSRAILASINQGERVYAYTFGKDGCSDIEIAKHVAIKKGCRHTVYSLDTDNWLNGRFSGIWQTDGMLSLLHMHANEAIKKVKENVDIDLNGFAGDLICGGSWIINKGQRICAHTAKKKFGKNIIFDDIDNSFYHTEHEDPYFLNNRVRRFTNAGTILISNRIEQRKPFIDNELIEFIYSLPDSYREHSKLYNESLLAFFPDLYKTIPWQHTGLPISKTPHFFHRLKKVSLRGLAKFGFYNNPEQYTDYPNWIRTRETIELFTKILKPGTAIYANYHSENLLEKFLEPHIKKKQDYSEQICRAVTVEIWLQQVFNKKYLDLI